MLPFKRLASLTLMAVILIGAAMGAVMALMAAIHTYAGERNTLAILNLRATNFEAMGYSGDILYALSMAMEKEKIIKVMPRREMEDILFREGLAQSDSFDMALKAGRALGIDFILFGQVTKEKEVITAELKLLDITAKEVMKTWPLTFPHREAIRESMPSLVTELSALLISKRN